MLFSKALFKQSMKSNAVMWSIITFANCFILACVMLISGQGSISTTKNAFEDTIIQGEIESSLKNHAIVAYKNAKDGEHHFDQYYVSDLQEYTINVETYKYKCDAWLEVMPSRNDYQNLDSYYAALATWKSSFPTYSNETEGLYASYYSKWMENMPDQSKFSDTESYFLALNTWKQAEPNSYLASTQTAYKDAINQTKQYVIDKSKSIDPSYTEDSDQTKEMLAEIMYTINPANQFDSFYTENKEEIPDSYDVETLVRKTLNNEINDYLSSDERNKYINERSSYTTPIFLANVFTNEDTINALIDALSEYGVSREKYDSFGYNYSNLKHMSTSTDISYQASYDYELSLIDKDYANGVYKTKEEYNEAIIKMEATINRNLSNSLINSLPKEVADALQEVGKMDIYSLIVGTIFFKMAGLLLPIIYMIMCSNNLIAGQVDSGSMAYVLSTGVKRKSVVFTESLFLFLSLLLMFICTTITSCVCLSQVHLETSKLNYSMLCLMNLGGFLCLFAMSGICFLTSCWFDRSKKAMAIGGGLSMFSLVATMLGLFGTPVLPSVIRLDALNYFNYASIITLFDVTSIVNSSTDYIYKFLILAGIGLLGYIVGSIKFIKKDLPL